MSAKTKARQCSFCVLTDDFLPLEFDEAGQCNVCKIALKRKENEWTPGEKGQRSLDQMVELLKEQGKNKPYDAMIGLSGGIDSAYLAHWAVKERGLRVLAVHVDAGWNSSPAVMNIEKIVRALNIDLHTHVIEWHEMRDIQLSFLEASVFNQDIPQDHAFFATLYRTADKFGIPYFLNGVNFASENISPPGSGPSYLDSKHIKGIHKIFGEEEVTSYPLLGLFEFLYLTKVKKSPKILKPLNFMDYDKEAAKQLLHEQYGWIEYGNKHCESRFTKFFQEVFLPDKFNLDKRTFHYSSLIVSGQCTRAEALKHLRTPIISDKNKQRDIKFAAKKLGVTEEDLKELIRKEPIDHMMYPNQKKLMDALISIRSGLFRKNRKQNS